MIEDDTERLLRELDALERQMVFEQAAARGWKGAISGLLLNFNASPLVDCLKARGRLKTVRADREKLLAKLDDTEP